LTARATSDWRREVRMKEHDPATCKICMSDWWNEEGVTTIEVDAKGQVTVAPSTLKMFGEAAPNSWGTTPDSERWAEEHKAAGYQLEITEEGVFEKGGEENGT
jgi:hypothetical protein